jgi:hypothetical protein
MSVPNGTLFRQPFQCATVCRVHIFHSILEDALVFVRPGGFQDQGVTVRGYLDFRVSGDVQQFQHGFINDQCQTVAMFSRRPCTLCLLTRSALLGTRGIYCAPKLRLFSSPSCANRKEAVRKQGYPYIRHSRYNMGMAVRDSGRSGFDYSGKR